MTDPKNSESRDAQRALDANTADPRSTPEPETPRTTHDPEFEEPATPRNMPSEDNTDRRA